MTTPEAPDDATLADRLGALSPEQRALLARRLAAQRGATAGAGAIARREGQGPAPLTHAQEALWLHEQMQPGAAAYNVPIARRVRGPLDERALAAALDLLVARHEALRTRVTERDGAPAQEPLAPRAVRVERHDLRASPAAEREAAAHAIVREIGARPFDLADGTFPRGAVVSLSDDEAVVVLVVHHVVCDGASIGVLVRELAEAYAACAAGRAPALAEPALQLADVAAWERGPAGDARVREALAFWREYLAGAPAAVELPTDRPRPGLAAAPAARAVRVLPPAVRDAVRALARANGATPFMVLLAGFQALLHRVGGQDDLVVGAPVAGRAREELRGVVGHLATTVALRARFDEATTFAALLDQARAGTARAFDHQEVAFERVARELRAAGAADAGAFNVAIVLQDGSAPVARLGDAALEPYAADGGAAKFDLTLSLTETADGVRASLEYRSDLFDAATVDALLERYERLLAAATLAPDVPVTRLDLMAPDERRTVLERWRGERVPYPRDATIHGLVAEQARRAPDAVAVECGDRALTYAELDERAGRVANRLRALGVLPGEPVALCVERSIEMVVGALGILKAGGAYVPLDPTYPAARLALIVGDARPRVLLTQASLVGTVQPVAGVALETLCLDADWPTIASGPAAVPDAGTAEGTAYVIYTSGSTGVPKGVAAAHRGVVRLVANPTYARLGPEETLLSFAPLTFDASTFEIWGALCTGARLVVFPAHAPSLAELGDVVAARGVTTLWLTAALFHQFVDANAAALRPLRQLLAGGDVLSVAHVRRVFEEAPGCTVINGYGPTENTTFTCCHVMTTAASLGASVPIGRPIGNTTVYILDRWMQPVPPGMPGRLYTGGDGLALGYLNRPELTAERFVADPFDPTPGARLYDTGDVARWRRDGTVEFLGRADAQLKIRGFRIEPGEVEAALIADRAVRECVVVGRPDGAGEKRLVAYVVPSDTAAESGAALRARLAERLPAFMVPATVVWLDVLPLTESGKVDRRALPAPAAAAEPDAEPAAPRDDVERVVAGVWAEVLGRPSLGVDTSFFDLGGHSLLATRVVAQVSKIFRARLTLRRFFDDPTVAGVARALAAEEPKPGQARQIAALLLKIQNMTPEERERLRQQKARPDQPAGTP